LLVFLGRSAALRDGLRREEGAFPIIIFAALKRRSSTKTEDDLS